MTELDDIALQSRLRALRAQPPDGDFEQRLLARLNAAELRPASPPVRSLPRRRAATLAAAGVLLIGTSAAAWFTGVVLPARSARTDDAPAAESKAKAARRPHHARTPLPPPVPVPAPMQPAVQASPPAPPTQPAPPIAPAATHDQVRSSTPRLRIDHRPEAAKQAERVPAPLRTLEAPTTVPQQRGSENIRLVMPERVHMSTVQPAVPAAPEWNEQRSRVMQERARNAAWERRDLRELNPGAAHERAEQTGREHSARDLHRAEARERHERPAKK
jgi:hypothetical protein